MENHQTPSSFFSKWRESGQTVVEYLFLFAVTVVMINGVGKKLKNFLVGPGGVCPNQSIVCKIIDKLQAPGNLSGNFRYFSVRK
jgi:hypothetical protein